ncbi:MAG TPA: hypothetical protein VFO76_00760 [Candidatus Kapabacteria bacterium]|nr:hypothetical protein [Candidatus Kapabacteria bacterium]
MILEELHDAKITCWLAGGALRDYFMGKVIKTDYDLFFPNESEYEMASKYFKAKGAEIKWESDNGMKVRYNNKTYDLVKKFFDSPQSTIDNFDFTVSMFAVDYDKIYHGETSFIDLAKRQLMINKITYPASTMSRAFRYHRKGFYMCHGEMKKLFEAVQGAAIPQQVDNNHQESQSSGDAGAFFFGMD